MIRALNLNTPTLHGEKLKSVLDQQVPKKSKATFLFYWYSSIFFLWHKQTNVAIVRQNNRWLLCLENIDKSVW